MSLQEAKYTFLDSDTAAAKRMTSERITEFKGYNARGVRADGEMKDMSGLTSDEYPMLSVAKAPMAYGLVQYKGATQMLSKTQIDDDWNHDVLYAIAQDIDDKYRLYKDGTVVSGLELSADTQMVAINDKICFFPEKKWYSVRQGTVGNIDESVTRTDITVTVEDDESNNFMSSKLQFQENLGLTSRFKVGDAVTINCESQGEKMALYRSLDIDTDTDTGAVADTITIAFEVVMDNSYRESFDVPLAIPCNTSEYEVYVICDVGMLSEGRTRSRLPYTSETSKLHPTNLKCSASADGKTITIGYGVATSLGPMGSLVNIYGFEIIYTPQRRSLYLAIGTDAGQPVARSHLYASDVFSTYSGAVEWAETYYPTSLEDFDTKRNSWTKLVDMSNLSITKEGNGYRVLYAQAGPYSASEPLLSNGDITLYIDSGYVQDTPDPMVVGINGTTAVIMGITDKSISFPDNTLHAITGEQLSGESRDFSSITISRPCPDIDYVIEWNNRLWGCSNADNTIYCSKLGDPTNWQYYQNTSLDSYFAEQGSNGRWTGVGKYSTHLLFFKEDCVHKVYGNYPSEFQIVTQMCSGVREGSHKSVVTMEDGVLYHSRRGIMAYTGGIPTLISSEFGSIRYYDAVAGTDGYKYYVSLRDKWGAYSTFVYDADVGMWHRLGAYNISEFELHGNDLVYALSSETAAVPKRITDDATTYIDSWYAVFGPFDEYIENEKIYSIISIRYELATGKKLKVEISMDNGAWEQIEEVTGGATTGHEIEFIPERCDRFAIRLSGDGECKIKSLSRDFRVGSVQKENY